MPCVPKTYAWFTCPCVHVTTCQKRANFFFLRANVPINVPTCQRRANFSTWCTNVSKECQFFNLAYQSAKRRASYLTTPIKSRANFSTIFSKNYIFYIPNISYILYILNIYLIYIFYMNIFFYLLTLCSVCKMPYLQKHTSYTQ